MNMSAMLQDIRVGIRSLARSPGFVLTATLTLALGIGLATAVYTVADVYLLRPLPVREQDRVIVLWGATRDGQFDNVPLQLAPARDFATRVRSLERVELFSRGDPQPVPIRDGTRIFRLRRSLVSGGFFELLGTRPAVGRLLEVADDVVGAAPVVVLSHRAWQQHFGGDSRVVGRRLVLHETDVAHTIVGVLPQGLDYPRETEFWAPVIPALRPLGNDPAYAELHLLGRLRPAASARDAGRELTAFFGRPEASAWEREVRGVTHPLANVTLGDAKPAVFAFAAAAGLLLLITCINVANLLLVRGLERVREIAVRSALGARRRRIVGQLVTESGILASAGGILGAAVASIVIRLFVAFAPSGLPRLDEIRMSGSAVAGAIAITALVTLLFALAPAIVTSRVDLQGSLRSNTRQGGASRRFRLGTEGLVVGQVALALLVLSAAGLITRSLIKLQTLELAFESSELLIGELALPYERFGDTRTQRELLDRLVPRLEAIPGVGAVSPVLSVPYAGGIDGRPATDGQSSEEQARNPILNMEVVTPNYFETFGIPVLRGRAFTDGDRQGAPSVVVISQTAAALYWPGAKNALGKRLTMGAGSNQSMTVVGIVPDTRYRDLRNARPSVYFPLGQSSFPVAPMTLAIRIDGKGSDPTAAIRRAVEEVEAGVALASVSPFERFLERPRAQPRLNAVLLSVFALAAVALAAVGLYGVMATMVRQRTRELGVRMALGATGRDLVRMIVRRGLVLATLGTAVGLLGASVANRVLRALLFEVSPTDAPTLGTMVVALLGVAAVASLIPARASTRIDPVVALRADG
jgi:putative ABC transport system permease protein